MKIWMSNESGLDIPQRLINPWCQPRAWTNFSKQPEDTRISLEINLCGFWGASKRGPAMKSHQPDMLEGVNLTLRALR